MGRYKQRLHELMNRSFGPFRMLPLDEVESVGQRVLDRLQREPAWEAEILSSGPRCVSKVWKLRWPVVALVAVAMAIAVLLPARVLRSAPAILEDSAGSRKITFDEVASPRGVQGGMLKLTNGSIVEMRSESELWLERAGDGLRVHVRKGDVIVNTSAEPAGRLLVETKDMAAAGEVFLVSAMEEGSRVAAIGGQARVQQGGIETKLLPGGQVTTAPTRETRTVGEEIFWSREAMAHVALLQQSATTIATGNPEFEVASVRVNASGLTASRMEDQRERVAISNATPEQIIRYAFNDQGTKISGPALLNSMRYDIVAKAPSGTPDVQLRPMLQALLMDRFKMRFHRETTEMPVYALTVGKDGHKLKEIKPGEPMSGRGSGAGVPRPDGLASMTIMGDLPNFAIALSRTLDRPVIDKTGLPGRFTVVLTYLPDRLAGTTGVSGPSIFTALQEQLGLNLESQRAPVEILVIDQIQEPTPN